MQKLILLDMTKKEKQHNLVLFDYSLWRRFRDLNPSGACTPYRFSRPTPSATWVNLRMVDPVDPDTTTTPL